MSEVQVKVPDIGDFKDVAVIELMVKVGETIAVDTGLVHHFQRILRHLDPAVPNHRDFARRLHLRQRLPVGRPIVPGRYEPRVQE